VRLRAWSGSSIPAGIPRWRRRTPASTRAPRLGPSPAALPRRSLRAQHGSRTATSLPPCCPAMRLPPLLAAQVLMVSCATLLEAHPSPSTSQLETQKLAYLMAATAALDVRALARPSCGPAWLPRPALLCGAVCMARAAKCSCAARRLLSLPARHLPPPPPRRCTPPTATTAAAWCWRARCWRPRAPLAAPCSSGPTTRRSRTTRRTCRSWSRWAAAGWRHLAAACRLAAGARAAAA
jgi:hypothetical protein